MAGYMGYSSEAEFKKAIDRELALMEYHDRGGRDPSPQPQTLRGKPGSRERWKQAAAIAGDSKLVNEAAQGANAEALMRSVQKLQRNGLDVAEVNRLVKLTLALDRGDVAYAVWERLPDEVADVFESELGEAFQKRQATRATNEENAERKRLTDRQAMLEAEYAAAEAHSPDALDAVNTTAHEIGSDLLYDPNADPGAIQAAMRAAGFSAASQRDALGQLATHAALAEEFKRGVGAPGSSWNDEERAQWEAELDETVTTAAERRVLTPVEAAELAVESVTEPPGPSLKEQIEEETRRWDRPEHADRLRDLAVSEWEAQHPEHAPRPSGD